MTIALVLFLIGVACIVFDMFAGTLAVLWIGIAFLVTSLVYFFTEGVFISLLVFAALTVIAIYSTKKMKINKETPKVASGVYAYIGRKLRIEEVDTDDKKRGTVSLNGETWNCLASEPLKLKEVVEVYDIIGATLLVKKEDEL